MKRMLIPLLVLLATGLAGPARGEEVRRVTAVRCWPFSDTTRVVIEVTGEFTFHAERAHDPERIFFDVLHSRPQIDNRRFYAKTVDDTLVKKIRVAEPTEGVTRVVLDLQSNAEYTVDQLSNPDRLVIELRPKGTSVVTQALPTQVLPTPALPTPALPTPALPTPPALSPAQVVLKAPRGLAAEARPSAGAPAESRAPASLADARAPAAGPLEASHAAKLTSDGAGSLTRALGLKIRRIVLDPGHGGHDDGTAGPSGLLEKDLVLDVALRLGKLIESRMGGEVIYTRTDDTFIPLERRTAIANEKKADLFLSIHANSSPYPRIGGVESYYLNFTTAKDALAVASRENASSDKSVFELHDLIQKITLQDKAEESKEFAGRIQAALFPFAARYDSGIKNRGIKKAPFIVLIGASMPSVLAEIGFLSNAKEEALLSKPEHRQKLAEALYRGVSRYSQSLSHFEIAKAGDPVKN
ncbi:MAG TPA: N-acetylmuramoyl-L-alanine amidase [Bryobacteraceae bacterium]|nr:N-acetylmuramoyl-L-alanine amidase [Bryobacteraceae bacterium]